MRFPPSRRTSHRTLPVQGASRSNISRGRSTRINLSSSRPSSSNAVEMHTPPSQRSGSLPRRALGIPRSRTNSMALLPGLTRSHSLLVQLRRTESMSARTNSNRIALGDAHTNILSSEQPSNTVNVPTIPGITPANRSQAHSDQTGGREQAEEDFLTAEMQGMMLVACLRTPSPQTVSDPWSIGKSPHTRHIHVAASSIHSSPVSKPPMWLRASGSRSETGPKSPVSPSASYPNRFANSPVPRHRQESTSIAGTKVKSQSDAKKRTAQACVKTELVGRRLIDTRRKAMIKIPSSSGAPRVPSRADLGRERKVDEDDQMTE